MSDASQRDPKLTEWETWQPEKLDTVTAASNAPPIPDDASEPIITQCAPTMEISSALTHSCSALHAEEQDADRDTIQAEAGPHRNGYEEGYAAGYAEGRKDGDSAAQREARELQNMVSACAHALGRLDHEVADTLTELSLSIAKNVVRSTLDTRPEIILELVQEMLRQMKDVPTQLTLHMHPDDAALVQKQLPPKTGDDCIAFIVDPAMDRGGCVATSEFGEIDARLSTRWQRARQALNVAREQQEAE